MPHARNLRKGRVSTPGRPYLCTTVVAHREPVFANLIVGRNLVGELRRQDERGVTRTIAFVVMPDHLHWLFDLRASTLSRILADVKRRSAHAHNVATGHTGALWVPGFHDHAVRREEDLESLVYYVVHNPVRAGLVASIGDYALWDARIGIAGLQTL